MVVTTLADLRALAEQTCGNQHAMARLMVEADALKAVLR